jgi:hypothetical protein
VANLLDRLPVLAILIIVGLIVLYNVPRFGHRVLALLRDLRDFRDGR